jgi:hypothetical protein
MTSTHLDDAELLVDSLRRRMAAMHSLYYQAVETMDLHHVNHFERPGVLPIAFSLFHYTNMHDASFFVLTSIPPVWDEAWRTAVKMVIDDHGKERTVADMERQRIGDYDAFKAYQRAVFERTEQHLATIEPESLRRVVIPRPFPEVIASTFSARCAGPEGVTALDGFECWLYQHGLRHMGEIELARGLVGLGGMTS